MGAVFPLPGRSAPGLRGTRGAVRGPVPDPTHGGLRSLPPVAAGGRGTRPAAPGTGERPRPAGGLGTKLRREGPKMGSSAQASGAQPAAPERPTGAPAATGRRKGAPAGQRRDYPHGLETAKKRLLPLRAPPRRGKDPLSAAARPPALPARWLGGGGWSGAPHPPGTAFRPIPLQPPPFQRSSRRRLRGLSRRRPRPLSRRPRPLTALLARARGAGRGPPMESKAPRRRALIGVGSGQ